MLQTNDATRLQDGLDWAVAYHATTKERFYWEMCAIAVARELNYPHHRYVQLARNPPRLIAHLRRAIAWRFGSGRG